MKINANCCSRLAVLGPGWSWLLWLVLAALAASGFTGNPLLHPSCFAKVSTSYWGAVASWLAVYQWTIALPRWVPSWTGCPTGDVPFDLVWAAAADGRLRCVVRAGTEARDLTTRELRKCMTWVGRQHLRYARA